jgi:hypothetical protein
MGFLKDQNPAREEGIRREQALVDAGKGYIDSLESFFEENDISLLELGKQRRGHSELFLEFLAQEAVDPRTIIQSVGIALRNKVWKDRIKRTAILKIKDNLQNLIDREWLKIAEKRDGWPVTGNSSGNKLDKAGRVAPLIGKRL